MDVARRGREDAGSLSLETAAVTPIILLFFTFVIAVGTLQNDHGTMDAATQAAARAASITRAPASPRSEGVKAANAVFTGERLGQCVGTVHVRRPSGTGEPTPPNYYNSVTAVGRCHVRISFGIFTLTESVSSTFTSVIDTYRGR